MKPKVFGVLIPTVDAYNQEKLWEGMVDYAKKHTINLLFFCGSPLAAPQRDVSAYNSIYNLARTQKVDGLTIVSGTLSKYITKDKLEVFLSKFAIPKVSISHSITNASNILIDNKKGMEMLVDHLIEEHNYENIAFITGLLTNEETKPRLHGYKTSLLKHNYKIKNDLIYNGDWTKTSIIPITHEIFFHSKIKPDCIVCSNDEMAIAMYQELKKYDPLNYTSHAITGFDNTQDAELNNPPLTTVDQPLHKMGYSAIQLLEKSITIDSIENVILTPKLIVSQSCGCLNFIPNIDETIAKFEYKFNDTLNTHNLREVINKLKAVLIDMYPFLATWHNYPLISLIDALYSDIQTESYNGKFLRLFHKTISTDPNIKERTSIIRSILYTITNQLCTNTLSIGEMKTITNIYSLSNIFLTQLDARTSNEFNNQLKLSRKIAQHNNRTFNIITDYKSLLKSLKNTLKTYDLSVFVVCLYDDYIVGDRNGKFDYPPQMNIFLAYYNGKFISDTKFNTKDIIPAFMESQHSSYAYTLYPIVFNTHQFGYVISDTETSKNLNFINIIDQISNSLERIQWYTTLAKYNTKLELLSIKDELTGLFNRRGFYDFGQELYNNAKKKKQNLGLLYIDLDGLKQINDQYGHSEGDYAIHKVGEILKTAFPKKSIVSRIGGDEYTVIYKFKFHHVENDIQSRAEEFNLHQEKIISRLKDLISQENNAELKPYPLSISIGFSIYDPNKPLSFEDLMIKADQALYREKKSKKRS